MKTVSTHKIRHLVVVPLAVALLTIISPLTLHSQDLIHREAVARQFFDHLIAKEVDEMMEMFSETFLEQVSKEQITEIAQGLESQLGTFSHVSRAVHDSTDGHEIVTLVCKFGEQELGMRITMDAAYKVSGFHITMPPPESYTPPPAWVDSTSFKEISLVIDCGDIELPARLAMPKTDGVVPVVLLVHGSGPHDKDETIGPNKIFRDIAWGLAHHGIASLRYEKRTFRHSQTLDMENFTVWDEAGRDAVVALESVMGLDDIDSDRVYLLGHSLGGMIAPRIAREVPGLSGIISMAGSPRYLYEIIPDQIAYLGSLQGKDAEVLDARVKELRAVAESLAAKRKDPHAEYDEELFGMPPSYLADMNRYDIGTLAAGLSQRILILQGGRDYQVTMQDYKAWKEALEDHPDTSFVLYPEFNHLFYAGEGAANPDEYFEQNNVDKMVIEDIADWIWQVD